MLGDGVGKEVWLIKSRADLVSDLTWVVLQDGTKYAPFVASRDFNWHLIRHEGKEIMAKNLVPVATNRPKKPRGTRHALDVRGSGGPT
jgi:hypothetical protein